MLARFLLELQTEGRSPHTVRVYRCIIGQWQASGLDALQWLLSLDGSLNLSSRRFYGRKLHRYLKWCVAHGHLDPDPLAGLCFREPPPTPQRPFSDDQVRSLLAACESEAERAIILLLYDTGIRASELVGLEAEDVDFEEGTLRIAGKGNKVRMVAASLPILEALRGRVNGSGPVFPFDYQQVHRLVKAIGKRASVQDVHCHRFRHTFADAYLRAGGDRGDLRLLLGHSSYKMVDRYCSYFEQERAVAAHRRLSPAARLRGLADGRQHSASSSTDGTSAEGYQPLPGIANSVGVEVHQDGQGEDASGNASGKGQFR